MANKSATLLPQACVLLCLSCAGGSEKTVQGTFATTTRIADQIGAVVVHLCDQAEGMVLEKAPDMDTYNRDVAKIREVCNAVGSAYDALAESQAAVISAKETSDSCLASIRNHPTKLGAKTGCADDLSRLASTTQLALVAGQSAYLAAQNAVSALVTRTSGRSVAPIFDAGHDGGGAK